MTGAVRGAGGGVRGALFAALMFAAAATASAQAPDGAVVYKDNCSTCHDAPTGRTPSKDALKDRTPEAILNTMSNGTMQMQAVQLSTAERRGVAEYLAGKPFGSAATAPSAANAGLCTAKPAAIANIASQPQWNGFGVDSSNSRYQPKPGMTAADVPNLKLKWAFAFPGGTQAYGNPAIVAGRVFVGSDNGTVYALDAATGCTYWSFKADGGVRTAPSVGVIGRKYAVYIGDLKANVFALDAETGAMIWKKTLDTHRFARITGAPVLADGKIYVPVSSTEEAPAAQPKYECCTFRGSVVALAAATGEQLWKSYTITEAPTEVGRTSIGTPQYAPAGAAVWNSPTIDRQKGVLYIGTGNSYTGPAVKTSDSVIAMDLKTGKIVWWNQVTGGDAFLVGCRAGLENCPKEIGPDHDFGNAPILRTLPGGKRIIVIGQKSGTVWGLDPDARGKVLWQFKAGKGGALGGIEWGSAADETAAYIPVSDVLTAPNDAGGLFALNLADGQPLWHTPAPKLECNTGRGCTGAQSAPVSVIPGVVFSGSVDGHMRAYSTKDGSILWDFNTVREYETVNHVAGKGGSIDAAGPAIADGLLVTNSGYALWRGLPGNVLLAFSAK
ncbi:MAG: cytochrome Cbb3 [Acidobacteria bacterium]|nr:cytochrome Cbb3 [Acidobacteriota bacterium]